MSRLASRLTAPRLWPAVSGGLLVLALGCGERPAPPPGADKETPALEVDLGSDTNSSGEKSDADKKSSEGAGAPTAEPGDK